MEHHKTVMLTLILTLSVVLLLSLTGVAQTQSEISQEACDEYKKADTKMNTVYQQILKEYGQSAIFIQKLKIAQRAWIQFRDAHLDSLYPQEDKQAEYGSAYPMCRCSALTEVTKKRTEELKRWVEGVVEGDVCSGSIHK